MGYKTEYYFECHVTINPVYRNRLDYFKEICKKYNFRVAELLMKKRSEDTPILSQYDSFCTGRSINYMELFDNMVDLITELKQNNFKVLRYKIENTLLDSRQNDFHELL